MIRKQPKTYSEHLENLRDATDNLKKELVNAILPDFIKKHSIQILITGYLIGIIILLYLIVREFV